MSLPSKTSSGYDNLSQLDVKIFGEQIVLPLGILINEYVVEGIVPKELKIAKIIPVFNSNANDNISSYRAISILPTNSQNIGNICVQ